MIISAYAKGDHRYVLRFDDTQPGRIDAMRAVRDFASNPELNFNWLDAAQMAKSIRELPLFSGDTDGNTEEDRNGD